MKNRPDQDEQPPKMRKPPSVGRRPLTAAQVDRIETAFARPVRPVVDFDPATICPCREHRRFWRSVHGHLVCAGCHPPARPGIVAEFVEVEPRPVPPIVLQSIDRSRRTLQTVDLTLKPAQRRRSQPR